MSPYPYLNTKERERILRTMLFWVQPFQPVY